jgi:hypothetical protein
MIYEDATDGIQHTAWQFREPHRFDPVVWGYDVADIQRFGNAIDDAWVEFDDLLGVLLKEFGPTGNVMVVSDHGFMPREMPSVYLDMNALLHNMRYLEFNEDGSVDFSRTTVYWSTRDLTNSFTDLSVNIDHSIDLSTATPSDLDRIVQQVTDDLMQLEINGGKPLFEYVTPIGANGERSIRVGLTRETMKKGQGRIINIGKKNMELDQYLRVVPDGSGRHDPFGMFVFSGPGMNKGQVVIAGAVHTVLNDLLGHLRGLSNHTLVESIFHLLGRFGIINPYTTYDVAPTLLYLADCPIPEYAVGSVMDRSISSELIKSRAIKYVEGYDYEQGATGGDYSDDMEQKLVERLKALGYVD